MNAAGRWYLGFIFWSILHLFNSNFYEYSCGQWIADAKIAADQGSASKSWDAAENNSYTVLRSLMEAEYPIDSEYVKVHDW